MLKCFCCGSEITSPQIFDGNIYGYTCIKKVSPNYKRTRKSVFQVELIRVEMGLHRGHAWFKKSDGTKLTCCVFKEDDGTYTYQNVFKQGDEYYMLNSKK